MPLAPEHKCISVSNRRVGVRILRRQNHPLRLSARFPINGRQGVPRGQTRKRRIETVGNRSVICSGSSVLPQAGEEANHGR